MILKSNVPHNMCFMVNFGKPLSVPNKVTVIGNSKLFLEDETFKIYEVAMHDAIEAGYIEVVEGVIVTEEEQDAIDEAELQSALEVVAKAKAKAKEKKA